MALTEDQKVLRDHANSCFQNEAPASGPGPQVTGIVKPSIECSIIIQHTITTCKVHDYVLEPRLIVFP